MKILTLGKLIGLSALAFGLGILVSFFLPDRFLVVIETVIIVAISVGFEKLFVGALKFAYGRLEKI